MESRGERVRRLDAARGLMLGAALGDAAVQRAAGRPTGTTGIVTQFLCVTAESMIRADCRANDRGLCNPAAVVWRGYARWAYRQGIDPERIAHAWSEFAAPTEPPNGWLALVPLLAERRGSAPAVVDALLAHPGGLEPDELPGTGSMGAHAVSRVLGAAALGAAQPPEAGTEVHLAELGAHIASWTHGHPAGWSAAGAALVLLGRFSSRRELALGAAASLDERTRTLLAAPLRGPAEAAGRCVRAGTSTAGHPLTPAAVRALAPDSTAYSALAAAVGIVTAFPISGSIDDAFAAATNAPQAAVTAALVGGLLGGLLGASALSVAAITELDLGWVVDTLARDSVAQILDVPGGGEWISGPDPYWLDRYPTW